MPELKRFGFSPTRANEALRTRQKGERFVPRGRIKRSASRRVGRRSGLETRGSASFEEAVHRIKAFPGAALRPQPAELSRGVFGRKRFPLLKSGAGAPYSLLPPGPIPHDLLPTKRFPPDGPGPALIKSGGWKEALRCGAVVSTKTEKRFGRPLAALGPF